MDNESDFNPQSFLDSAVVEAELSTQSLQCPEGTYRAQAEPVTAESFRQVDTEKQGKRTICRVLWNVLDDTVRAELEREKVLVSQDLWLDFDSSGALDTGKGKNADLGRLREAIGQNAPGRWTFGQIGGAAAIIKVVQRTDTNSDRKYAEVRRVSSPDSL